MLGTDVVTMQANNEARVKALVAHLNGALRRAWFTESPRSMYPFTVGSGTVTVTDGLIAANLLGAGTCYALFSEDPRTVNSCARVIDSWSDHEGVHLKNESLGSVYAFYRNAVPVITYEVGGAYTSPNDIPEVLQDIVPMDAVAAMYVGMQAWDALNALKAVYGQPAEERAKLGAALLKSRMPWTGHCQVLATSVSGGTVLPWITVFNGYVRVTQPDGTYMYLQGFGAPP